LSNLHLGWWFNVIKAVSPEKFFKMFFFKAITLFILPLSLGIVCCVVMGTQFYNTGHGGELAVLGLACGVGIGELVFGLVPHMLLRKYRR